MKYDTGFGYWLRLRNWYWVKTKPKLFLLEKAMTATDNGLTKELATQLAKAAFKKSARVAPKPS